MAVYSFDQSQVWASQIGVYWMDFDSEGISIEILSDSDNDCSQLFIPFVKSKNYSISPGILKIHG